VKAHSDFSIELSFGMISTNWQKRNRNRNIEKGKPFDDEGFTFVTRGGYGQSLGGGVSVASKRPGFQRSGETTRNKNSSGLEGETRDANANHGWIFRQSKKVYKIKNLTDEEATLVEPASCAIHGLDKLNPPVGVEALIFGAGPTGEFHCHTTF
jgi:hypothetical protein